ncbi:ABC transporter substrate-binding protein [Nonomuraea sp. NN258]|uniref:ABC transporter substrate-binding protein n=1 Tax=Nonomuraea antri TaxID=2730852 RepID=UPI00156845FA|nr:ABC transporter substrate-binding protein [Nonomuraea antri]NRQ36868.1 ABC transporter substrate-binding protein [Nonomuraea antri]
MRWHKRLLVAGITSAVALTTASCGSGETGGTGQAAEPTQAPSSAAPAQSPTQSAPQAQEDGKPFVYAHSGPVITDWDPATTRDIAALANVYETLTRYDSGAGKPVPALATEWSATGGGKVWTFKLRQGVTFHSGAALDAAAAKKAIERTMSANPDSVWAPVQKIAAPDAGTLTFTLKHAARLDLIAAAPRTAYVYDTEAIDKSGKSDGGTGPYTVAAWRKGQENELELKAYDGYWEGWRPGQYRKATFRVTSDAAGLLARGEADFAAGGESGVTGTPSFESLLVRFNVDNRTIRQALRAAIDYDGVVAALGGEVVKGRGLVPPGLTGHTPSPDPAQDLAETQRLVESAGYGPDNPELTLTVGYDKDDEGQATLVKKLRATLGGVNVSLRAKPGTGQDITLTTWAPAYPDAYPLFRDAFSGRSKELDQAIAALAALDGDAAVPAYADLQKKLVEDEVAAVVPYVRAHRHALGAGIGGYVDEPAYPHVVFLHDLARAAG